MLFSLKNFTRNIKRELIKWCYQVVNFLCVIIDLSLKFDVMRVFFHSNF